MTTAAHFKGCELTKLKKQQANVLWIVLFINLVMFFVEFGAGIRADSISLTGDSLDMLGDTLVYASSLYVINKGSKAQAGSAFMKGIIMFVFAIGEADTEGVSQFLLEQSINSLRV